MIHYIFYLFIMSFFLLSALFLMEALESTNKLRRKIYI